MIVLSTNFRSFTVDLDLGNHIIEFIKLLSGISILHTAKLNRLVSQWTI